MNGSVLAGVDRRKIMRSFLDGQRVSTRVYVHTTANEAEKKKQQEDVMDLLLSFRPPHLSVVVRDVLLNHCNVLTYYPVCTVDIRQKTPIRLITCR